MPPLRTLQPSTVPWARFGQEGLVLRKVSGCWRRRRQQGHIIMSASCEFQVTQESCGNFWPAAQRLWLQLKTDFSVLLVFLFSQGSPCPGPRRWVAAAPCCIAGERERGVVASAAQSLNRIARTVCDRARHLRSLCCLVKVSVQDVRDFPSGFGRGCRRRP